MESTPNLLLPYIVAAQAQKHVTHNEAIRALDAVVQLSVLDRDLASPPVSPVEGERYLVAALPTGDWIGQVNRLAAWQDGVWAFYTPLEGWICWIKDEDILVVWDGASWIDVGGGGTGSVNPTSLVGVNATADATNRLSVSSPATLFSHEGSGHQIKVNKNGAGDTASLLFQTAFAGRAEMGTAGDDDFQFKVSADGASWKEAIRIDRSTGAVAMPLTSSLSTPNILINGDFQINQRGFGGGALAAGQYGFDRWKGDSGGADVSLSGYSVTLTSGTLVQSVEPAMAGVVNFASMAITISLEDPSDDIAVVAGSVSGTIIAGSGRRSVSLTPGAGDTGNLVVKISKASAGSVSFNRLKMELGTIATPWSAKLMTEELSNCQRYYQKSYGLARSPGTGGLSVNGGEMINSAHGSGNYGQTFIFLPMLAAPVITVYDSAGTSGKVTYYNGAWVDNGMVTVATAGEKLAYIQSNVPGAIQTAFAYTLEAEL